MFETTRVEMLCKQSTVLKLASQEAIIVVTRHSLTNGLPSGIMPSSASRTKRTTVVAPPEANRPRIAAKEVISADLSEEKLTQSALWPATT